MVAWNAWGVAGKQGYSFSVAKLIVRRENDYGGRLRNLKVYVDDKQVAALRPNNEVVIDIGHGPHVIAGRMDWCRSPSLRVDGDDLPAAVTLSFPLKAFFEMIFRPRQSIRITASEAPDDAPSL